jgi:hypothetical protein
MPQKSSTTHTLMGNMLVVYQRERSKVWQCRFKVGGSWQRASTREEELKDAIAQAKDLLYAAVARKRDNVPVVTRKFRSIARRALQRLEDAADSEKGLRKYRDHLAITEKYLIPFFGKYNVASIDSTLLAEFDLWRTARMGKMPSRSTLQAHNAALNCVFDEAVHCNYLSVSTRPKLKSKWDKSSERRPALDEKERQALLTYFNAWIIDNNLTTTKGLALLLEDYLSLLRDTGAKPGLQLMDLKLSAANNHA